jgi:ABC-type nickel/cobalt efflux system permease component RcnA
MNFPSDSGFLLIVAVGVVGVLHTMVPDHWAPITLIARQRGWTKAETARAALLAGTGHVLSTLLIAVIVWVAGVAVATRFGHFVETASSIALIAFGGWVAISALREMRGDAHGHAHSHGGHGHRHDFSFLAGHDHESARHHSHGTEARRIETGHGAIELSIFEDGAPPRFRLSGPSVDRVDAETIRDDGARQAFTFVPRGLYWESHEEIPEPHAFEVAIAIGHGGHSHAYRTTFVEHGREDPHSDEDGADADPLYAPLRGDSAVLARHVHRHRHGAGAAHAHWHDHDAATAHPITPEMATAPPAHTHKHKTNARTALLLILGSSPMVEGIPAFFAAGKYGVGLILAMSAVFAASTIATYVLLCVASTAGLQRIGLGAFERYGEVLSGAFIALVGLAFWIWPVL